jgi:hypothetical protein
MFALLVFVVLDALFWIIALPVYLMKTRRPRDVKHDRA